MHIRFNKHTTLAGACLTLGLLASAAANAATVNGELTATSPTFNRPSAGAPCGLTGANYAYNSYPITHSGGTLTIEMLGENSGSGTLDDPFLHLYSGSFDPSQPCQNWVTGDDDSGSGWDSRISSTYPAGNYVIVATSYDPTSSSSGYGTYTLTYNSISSTVTPVPTLGTLGLLGLSLSAAALGARRLRRREKSNT